MTQKKIIVIVFFLVYCVVTTMGQSLKYYNADDFPLIGKMSDDTEGRYARLPLSCKEKSKKWVWVLGQDTPGLAIRFATNSTMIAAKWTAKRDNNMSHMAMVGVKGLDLYVLKMENGVMCVVRVRKVRRMKALLFLI